MKKLVITLVSVTLSFFTVSWLYAGPFDYFKKPVINRPMIDPNILKLNPLSLSGTDGDDTIEVKVVGADIKGLLNEEEIFSRPATICDPAESEELDLDPGPPLPTLKINGKSGNDTINVDLGFHNCPCEISGGNGNDAITVAGCHGRTVKGDGGNDNIHIKLFSENLKVYGGQGDDTLDSDHRTLAPVIYGGAGNDTFKGILDMAIGGSGADDFFISIPKIIVCDATDADIGISATYVFTNVPGGCAGACQCTTEF